MNRRAFFAFSMPLFLPGISFLKKESPFSVQFKFNLKKNLISADNFNRLRSVYENDDKISMLNKEYIQKGWILGHSFKSSDDELEWGYVFKNSRAFHQWESTLYANGYVQKEGRPYQFERLYRSV